MGIASTPSLGLSTNANGGLVGPIPFWDEGRNVPSPQPGSVVTGADGAKYILAKATGVIPPNTNVVLTEPAMTVAAGAGDWYSQTAAIPINNYAWFRASIQGGGGPVVPVAPDAVYIPTVATAAAVWYGMRRVITAYNGPLVQVQRASDNATMDVPQDTKGLPDLAAVVAWAAGSETRIRTWYDQTGQSRHATQTTWAQMPLFDAAGLYGVCTSFGAFKTALFDGRWANSTRYPKRLIIPNTVTGNYQNHSVFMVFQPKSGGEVATYYGMAKTGPAEALSLINTIDTNGIQISQNPSDSPSGRRPRAQFQTVGISSGASNLKYFQDGQVLTSAAKWSDTMIGGVLGDIQSQFQNFLGYENFLAWGFYPTALSDANSNSIVSALNSTFGLKTPASNYIVMVGDSILGGGTVVSGLEGRSTPRWIEPSLTGSPALYNLGSSSQTLTQVAANAANREDVIKSDAVFGAGKRCLVAQIGTNDFADGASVPAGFGLTMYNRMASYIAARRAAGFTHVAVCTVLPCSNTTAWQNQSSQAWIERNDYNARLRADKAGADVVIDLASHPVMGVYANTADAAYYQDRLHPTGEGLRLTALTGSPVNGFHVNYRDGINAMLALP